MTAFPQSLTLVHQTCVYKDNRYGDQHSTYGVVKNSPFRITFETKNKHPLDEKNCVIHSTLVYEDEKEVPYVKLKPLETISSISQNGTRIYIEARMKVLSSQHEGRLFRILVEVNEGNKGIWKGISHPIRSSSLGPPPLRRSSTKKRRLVNPSEDQPAAKRLKIG